MPVPTAITDLSVTASENSPAGAETVGTQANEYIQAISAFLRQVFNGAITPLAAIGMNSQKITGLAAGTVSTTSTDAINGSQLYKVNEIKMWAGAANNTAIAAAWGAGWYLCDGNNGTVNLTDKFVMGAGNTYANAATGGAATVTLATANLPAHNHDITDPGHVHGLTDPGHIHGVSDPGHQHNIYRDGQDGTSATSIHVNQGISNLNATPPTATATTNISINAASTGLAMAKATTGITTANTGTGTAVSVLNPYYALAYIQFVGA